MLDFEIDLGPIVRMLVAFLPVGLMLLGLVALVKVITMPLPGRGPKTSARDPWRGFKHAARRQVLANAGQRCEGSRFVAWGRCRFAADEVDHIYPWSRGGATVVSNGQALCRGHNKSKSNLNPPWWYTMQLERRRRGYFPEGVSVRVSAAMTDEDRAARTAASNRRAQRTRQQDPRIDQPGPSRRRSSQ